MGSTRRAVLHPAMLECVNILQSLDIQSPGRWQGERDVLWTKAQKEPWCPAFTRIELFFSWKLIHSPPIAKVLMVQKGSGPRQKLQPSQAREQSRQTLLQLYQIVMARAAAAGPSPGPRGACSAIPVLIISYYSAQH